MYSDAAIAALEGRIGWAQPMAPTSRVLTTENEGTTGQTFDAFHKLLTVENIEACMPVSNALTAQETITDSSLNAYLVHLRKQATLKVLRRLFDTNKLAQVHTNSIGERTDTSAKDWSTLIQSRLPALDECVGFQLAYDCLELILTTSRINYRERNGKENGNVRLEQQGATDSEGNPQIDGVFGKMNRAYKEAIGVLFPQHTKPMIRDRSNYW